MKTNCAYCGKEIDRSKFRVKKGRTYCNSKCQMKYEYGNGLRDPKAITKKAHEKMRQLIKEGKHPFQREDVREILRQVMQTPEHRLKARLAKLGSKNGMYGKRGKLHPNWNSIECKCQNCGKAFYVKASHVAVGEGKYCSKECFDDIRSVKIECFNCSKLFKVPMSRQNTAKYCSFNCAREAKTGEGAPNWRGGKSFEPYPPEFNNLLKERIRERDNYICQSCGTKENKRAFPVHHKDYDKANNEDWNLITLCDCCHKKTNHNREYWEIYFLNQNQIVLSQPYIEENLNALV